MLAFAMALLCAAAMGLAIQRGATCMVAAIDELLTQRRPTRLLAIGEAALWVAAGLLLARELGVMPGMLALPPSVAVGWWTVAGAALLGLGAVVGGACLMGVIGRVGSGDWAFAATPLGFYIGCLSVGWVFGSMPVQPPVPAAPLLLTAAPVLAWALLGVAAVRLALGLRQRGLLALHKPWSPHAATAVIGIAFVSLLLCAGPWAYTDVLAELARLMGHGAVHALAARVALAVALLSGALLGGHLAGRWRHVPVTALAVLRCLCGGVLMGWGSTLVPGGNDGLVLLGLPLLRPHAWVALAVMGLTIAGALAATRARR